MRIAVAESCTGGGLLSRLTDVPGSSAWVLGGVVAYANDVKVEQLGVPAALIAAHGAVSESVAQAMAEGVRERLRADVGVAITGIAGPDGGSPEKPVGTVVIATTGPTRGGANVPVPRRPGGHPPLRDDHGARDGAAGTPVDEGSRNAKRSRGSRFRSIEP